MTERCSGCGRVDLATANFHCTWPDGRVTTERHCPACRTTWQPQLTSLGVTLASLDGSVDVLGARRLGRRAAAG
jgi:hypothetical protein